MVNIAAVMDYHMHTELCRHASGKPWQYVEQAFAGGLREIGFSDHIPVYFPLAAADSKDIAMLPEELPYYVEQISQLQKKYPQMIIRLGLEADYIPGCEEKLQNIISQYPFDYILGSVHFLDGWPFDHPAYIERYQTLSVSELYRRYFTVVQQAAASGLFDILAHPDLIKKFGFRPEQPLTDIYRQTAEVVKKADICLEINTAGLRYPAAEIYPSPGLLLEAARLDIPVTLGSDAHCPEQVGQDFEQAIMLLQQTGVKKLAFFQQRERLVRNIEQLLI